MDEEASRILDMLEEGKITSSEAAALLRALAEPRERPSGTDWETGASTLPREVFCRDVRMKLRALGRAMRQAQDRRQRYAVRYTVWCGHQLKRKNEQARRHRERTMNTERRVQHVLVHSALVGTQPESESRLRDLLQGDQIAWDNFWFGLEEEFRLDIPPSDLRAVTTVGELVDYLERKRGGGGAEGKTTEEAATNEDGSDSQVADNEPSAESEGAEDAATEAAEPEVKESRKKSRGKRAEQEAPPASPGSAPDDDSAAV